MTRYIWELPVEIQQEIASALVEAGIFGADFERAMDGRVCDLEDAIDITPFK